MAVTTVRLTSLGGQQVEIQYAVDGTLEGLHSAVATQLDVEQEQVKLVNGASLLADQGLLANAGIPGFPESCDLGFSVGPLAEMAGYETRYDAWCGPCVDRSSDLHTAAGTNNVERVKELLSTGANVNSRGGDRELPIHHASRLGCLDTAALLIDSSADVNARNSYQNTVLQYACFRHPYDELVKKTSGVADVADYVENVHAARHNLRAMLTLLILAGADVEAGGDGGCTAMKRLMNGGHEDAVAMSILSKHQVICENGLASPEHLAKLLEENPDLNCAKAAFKLLLERNGGSGFEWAARMQARRMAKP